ncbi:hypothetical protein PVK06_008763 [Gossypium arboreum]|uniref:Uncharacterized protein n=1 Tax=Gossypium arboreum TaxID=29729 RepID=A0ABR0QL06_GOSAR|nr:hypothetical protein PVK06_008763 [Gossypium arboreum]
MGSYQQLYSSLFSFERYIFQPLFQHGSMDPWLVITGIIFLLRHGAYQRSNTHKWENFGKHPSEPMYILVVQEFYASLKEYEAKRPLGEPWSYVTVRGKEILILSQKNFRFYEVPFYM